MKVSIVYSTSSPHNIAKVFSKIMSPWRKLGSQNIYSTKYNSTFVVWNITAIQWILARQGLGNGQNSTRRLNICKCWLGNGIALCFSCIVNTRCSVRNEGGVLSINCRQLHVTTFLWGFSWTALRAPQTLSTEIVLLVMLSNVSCPWCVLPLKGGGQHKT